MKIIGHMPKERNLVLNEVVLMVSPDEARKIGAFLLGAAERMGAMGSDYEHEHLSDHEDFDPTPDLVLVKV